MGTSSCFHVTQVEEIKRIVGEAMYENEVVGPNGSPVSGGGAVAPTAVTGADVLADIAPASPGTWPSLTTYYVSTAAAGVDVGALAVWVPTDHPTIPAARGWRSQFAPFATVV